MKKQNRLCLVFNQEKSLILLIFVLSFLNTVSLIAATIVASLYLIAKNQNAAGAVKALIFVAVRTIINPGIASGYDMYGAVKWVIMLGLSGLAIISSNRNKIIKCRKAIMGILLFSMYTIAISFFNSSYPVVSSFKVISWIFVFTAVVFGINQSPDKDWLGFLSWLLNLVVIFSLLSIPLGIAYLRNGHAFQGLTNHPNMLGIVVSIAFAINIYLLQEKREKYRIIVLALCVIECILSESRTGVICIATSMVVYFLFNIESNWKKVILITLTVITVATLLIFGFGSNVTRYFYKGQSGGNLLYSRERQIANAMAKFKANPLIGSGFMVPFNKGYKSFEFSFGLIVEPGNIIFALLGDVGIVGVILFVIPYIRILSIIDKRRAILFLTPFIASMGEMMFFSTNNIAIIYYVLFGCCLLPMNTTSRRDNSLINKQDYYLE